MSFWIDNTFHPCGIKSAVCRTTPSEYNYSISILLHSPNSAGKTAFCLLGGPDVWKLSLAFVLTSLWYYLRWRKFRLSVMLWAFLSKGNLNLTSENLNWSSNETNNFFVRAFTRGNGAGSVSRLWGGTLGEGTRKCRRVIAAILYVSSSRLLRSTGLNKKVITINIITFQGNWKIFLPRTFIVRASGFSSPYKIFGKVVLNISNFFVS